MRAGKKISGKKVDLGVDILGLSNGGIQVTKANVTDGECGLEILRKNEPKLSKIIKVLCDGGYTCEKFANAVMVLINAEAEVAKRNELHRFEVIPQRWIVERSFAWPDNVGGLWRNCERLIHTTHQMVTVAFISVLLKRY